MRLLLAPLALLLGCFNPTSFRCDNSTGEDCDAGAVEVKDAGVDLAGTWSLRVVLEPRPDAGGRLTMPLTANVEQVKLVATAGGWRIEIPGKAGGCCLPEPFIAAGPALTMPPQAFRMGTGTPMQLRIAGMATVDYESTGNWNVTLLETTTGLLERGVLRFSRSAGETLEENLQPTADGGFDPLVYLESVELSR